MFNFLNFIVHKLSNFKIRLFSSLFLNKIFTKVNFNKFLIIFTVGLISRVFVNNISGEFVYVDFLHHISILYYIALYIFIVVVQDVASYVGFSLIPVFVLDILNFIISKIKLVLESFIKLIYSTIKTSMLIFSKLKYDDFKISSIRKVLKDSDFNFKDKMYLEDLSNDRDIRYNRKDTLLNTYVLNKNKDGSSNSHSSSSRLHSSGRHHSSNNSRSDSSSNRGIRNNDSITMNNSVNTSNNVVRSLASHTNNIEDNRLLFVVDTMNDGRGSMPLVSRAPTVAPLAASQHENNNSSFTYAVLPSIAYVPNNSPIPAMPRAPIPTNLSTPSTMTPLFPSQENINYQASSNQGVANNTNTRYSNSNYSNSIASTPAMAPNYTNIPYSVSNYLNSMASTSTNPIPGQSPYFNPTRSSTSTNQATLGLNGSNERL